MISVASRRRVYFCRAASRLDVGGGDGAGSGGSDVVVGGVASEGTYYLHQRYCR